MARINIEDDIEAHEEFWELAQITGDRDAAMGKLVRFFRLAQSYFGKGQVIPGEEIKRKGLDCMIESGWAIQDGEGFQVRGAKKHFDWYAQRVEAGKSRARAPRDAKGHFTPSETPAASSEQPAEPSDVQRAHQPLTPSLSLSPSLDPSLSLFEEEKSVAVGATAQLVEISPEEVRQKFEWEEVLKIYDDPVWVEGEVRKMAIWLKANRRRVPKSKPGWSRFIMGWLERGWERHRVGIPSQKPEERDWKDLAAERGVKT